ncbi:membrane protein insertion efficiency factor YidD [Streptomyces sp. NPDC014870]|uniref:membrane protein insertion efficiency factor YidD n=1 Tax=Streptomyces sp. NPDC014870 TaxID=3364925 RepID=UPI003700FFC7
MTSSRESARAARRRKRREDGEEGCCAGAADQCSACGMYCPQFALVALTTLLLGKPHASPRAARPAAGRPAGRAAGALLGAVTLYREEISPTRPPCCPYTPSCSTYAVKALSRHGALRGGLLTVARLLRCRPAAARRRGYTDPVPN